jgi:hypothetical protein
MRGAAAATAHRHASSKKQYETAGSSCTIEAMDSTLDKQESESNKKEDPEYIEEEDHLNLFPPLSYRKGDISLGVLMSG